MTKAMKKVVVLDGDNDQQIHKKIETNFQTIVCFTEQEIFDCCEAGEIDLIVLDQSYDTVDSYALLRNIKEHPTFNHFPVIIMDDHGSTEDKVKALELGASDHVLHSVEPKELAIRFERVILDHIASEQLKSQITMANEVAMKAMKGTSDLGTNIQFFIDSAQCDNLDILGMTLFQALNAYGLNCSVQMRSIFEVKNMEANGMAKELESQLLAELKDQGRYVDFGKRSVMNYESVSVLVKNMPVDDEVRYGELKDSVFSLLQGVDARVKALDNVVQVQMERDLVKLLTTKIQQSLSNIESGFHQSMKKFAEVVEDLSHEIEEVILAMGLHEDQENALENIVNGAMDKTNDVFSNGLKLDAGFGSLIKEMETMLGQSELSPREMATLIQKLSD